MAIIAKIENGQVSEVSNLWDLETSQNPGGFIKESHPYGLAAGPDGNLWVTDAGANELLKVNPATGAVDVVAVFDGVPSPLPNDGRGGAMESDPVPTGIAFGSDLSRILLAAFSAAMSKQLNRKAYFFSQANFTRSALKK